MASLAHAEQRSRAARVRQGWSVAWSVTWWSVACWAVTCWSVACLSAAHVSPAHPAGGGINYAEHYASGITFAEFLERARQNRDEWRATYNDAAVTADMVTRMRALPERRRLLVVAEDWCSDSLNTVPYIARLIDAAPERLQMRLIDTRSGQPIMDAHRTPDGRAATPTVVVLGEDGRFIAAWTERPSAIQTWFLEQQKVTMQKPLHDRLLKWYEDDAGRTTVAEIAGLLAR